MSSCWKQTKLTLINSPCEIEWNTFAKSRIARIFLNLHYRSTFFHFSKLSKLRDLTDCRRGYPTTLRFANVREDDLVDNFVELKTEDLPTKLSSVKRAKLLLLSLIK